MVNRYFVLMMAFVTSFILSILLTPTYRIADAKEPINLEEMIPKMFGDWKIAKDQAFVTAPTKEIQEKQEKEDEIYQQVLMRTYRNSTGERVMLAIAYGDEQSDSLQVHRPEVCYVFQGFQLISNKKDILEVGDRNISVRRLVAKNGLRIEPITYWITVGDKVVKSAMDRKIEQLKYGLNQEIPDGILMRISSIDNNEERAREFHRNFILSLLESVDQDVRKRLVGDDKKMSTVNLVH